MKDLDGFQAWLGNSEVNVTVLSFYHIFFCWGPCVMLCFYHVQ
jgi:hypothetical protein